MKVIILEFRTQSYIKSLSFKFLIVRGTLVFYSVCLTIGMLLLQIVLMNSNNVMTMQRLTECSNTRSSANAAAAITKSMWLILTTTSRTRTTGMSKQVAGSVSLQVNLCEYISISTCPPPTNRARSTPFATDKLEWSELPLHDICVTKARWCS